MTGPVVSVVVPVYRNAETVAELARRVHAALAPRWRYELILVDDACPAGSGAAVDAVAGAAAGTVFALHLARNGGQHRAALEGLRVARGSWHAILDADLQDPPEALAALLDRAGAGDVEVVFAGRRGRYESTRRLVTGRIVRRLLAALLGLPTDAGLYVLVSDGVRRRLLALDGPEPSVVAMIGCTRSRHASIPVARAKRPLGESSYTGGMRLASGARAVRWALTCRLRPTTHRE